MADDVRTSLERKRAELLDQLGELEKPGADAGGISFGKRVGEGTSLAVERLSQVAVHDRLREVLADVIRAQTKLTSGTYGRCDLCDTSIGEERLAALPWATHCVRCASRR